jgi:hypothetical protein
MARPTHKDRIPRRLGAAAAALAVATAMGTFSAPAVFASPRVASATGNLGGAAVPAVNVLKAVQAAQSLQSLPSGVKSTLTANDLAAPGFGGNVICESGATNKPGLPDYEFGECSYGDLTSKKLMVVYGDSHAGMWGEALQYIALRAGWKLVTFDLSNCPAPALNYVSWATNTLDTQCEAFHSAAPAAIARLHAQLVVVTSDAQAQQAKHGVIYTAAQWEQGWSQTLKQLRHVGTRLVMIGDIPQWADDSSACLAAHTSTVQDCASLPQPALAPDIASERQAASANKVQYISPTNWICGKQCEPVIDGLRVFNDEWDLTSIYVAYLSGALQQSLGIPNASS